MSSSLFFVKSPINKFNLDEQKSRELVVLVLSDDDILVSNDGLTVLTIDENKCANNT